MMTTLCHNILPDYAYQLLKRPHANPVFITIDWRCLKFVKCHGGICLFCRKNLDLSQYDFSLCYRREMWVIFLMLRDQAKSLQLGRTLQLSGASKVLIIPIAPELLSEVNNANR